MKKKLQLDNNKKKTVTKTVKKNSFYPPAQRPQRRYGFQGYCYYCSVWGHMQRHCWWRNIPHSRSRRSLKFNRSRRVTRFCNNCQKNGHTANVCIWRHSNQISRFGAQKNSTVQASKDKYCCYCNRYGHADDNCWSQLKPKPARSSNRFSVLEDLDECRRCGYEGHTASNCLTLLPEQEKRLSSTKEEVKATQQKDKVQHQKKTPKKPVYRVKQKEEANVVEVASKE